jgi:hypothetical protein
MNELIEKLKHNLAKYEENTPEEQECFEKVGRQNCEYLNTKGKWYGAEPYPGFSLKIRYRVKLDYQSEPEYVDYEIECQGWLGIRAKQTEFPYPFLHLHCIPSLPKFDHFWREDDKVYMSICGVATQISEGKTVFARFRK